MVSRISFASASLGSISSFLQAARSDFTVTVFKSFRDPVACINAVIMTCFGQFRLFDEASLIQSEPTYVMAPPWSITHPLAQTHGMRSDSWARVSKSVAEVCGWGSGLTDF
jgi:hypothetical protein